jgi:hypothetical protein
MKVRMQHMHMYMSLLELVNIVFNQCSNKINTIQSKKQRLLTIFSNPSHRTSTPHNNKNVRANNFCILNKIMKPKTKDELISKCIFYLCADCALLCYMSTGKK